MPSDESRKEEIRLMSLPKMQERFRLEMGTLKHMDRFYCHNEQFVYLHWQEYPRDPITRLPLPIDPVNPERGLLGMCVIPVQLVPIYNPDQDNAIVWWEASWAEEKHGENIMNHMGGETPTLALLLALMHQWEVKE